MRENDKDLKDTALNSNQVYYNYEIYLTNNQTIFITSKSDKIMLEDKIFYPYSGLNFKEGYFDDCAKDYIILEGIFERGGIDSATELAGAKIKIWRAFSEQKFYHLVTFYCTDFTKYDLGFCIQLRPETTRFGQSLLQCFSKTCRANFGDEKCKINKADYSFNYNISEINDRLFILASIEKEDGFFNGGEAIIGDQIFKAKIISHFRSTIEVDKQVPETIRSYNQITLIAGCDKKFITCCNKFHNAVNFRGEPFIPENNFLQIS